MKVVYLFVVLMALASSVAFAYDPSPLQDFCVAINDTKTGGIYLYSYSYINIVATCYIILCQK